MEKNTGKPYESLVEQVFVQLMKQDSVNNVIVEKNKRLKGKSTTHEIDVYWEFEFAGIKYITIIQAKDWAQNVPQGEILKLKAILDDLPGQPRGIFVTKTGYQSGALDFAKANGILIYELREPTENDWEGRIKTIIINYKILTPSSKVEPIPDEEWNKNELKRLGLKELKIPINEREDKVFIRNEDGVIWKSIRDLIDAEHKIIGMDVVQNKEVVIEMEQPRFIYTGNPNFPKIKINAVKLILSNSLSEETTEIDGTPMVGFVLKNLIDGSTILLDKNVKLKK